MLIVSIPTSKNFLNMPLRGNNRDRERSLIESEFADLTDSLGVSSNHLSSAPLQRRPSNLLKKTWFFLDGTLMCDYIGLNPVGQATNA